MATLNLSRIRRASCVADVEHALAELPGVVTIAVSLPEQQVDVLFDEAGTDAAQMVAALRGAGYDVAA